MLLSSYLLYYSRFLGTEGKKLQMSKTLVIRADCLSIAPKVIQAFSEGLHIHPSVCLTAQCHASAVWLRGKIIFLCGANHQCDPPPEEWCWRFSAFTISECSEKLADTNMVTSKIPKKSGPVPMWVWGRPRLFVSDELEGHVRPKGLNRPESSWGYTTLPNSLFHASQIHFQMMN